MVVFRVLSTTDCSGEYLISSVLLHSLMSSHLRVSKTSWTVLSACALWVPNLSILHGALLLAQAGTVADRCPCRNAGGRTSDLTSELVKTCQGLIGVETCMHLTCTNMPREKVDLALKVNHSTFTSIQTFLPLS